MSKITERRDEAQRAAQRAARRAQIEVRPSIGFGDLAITVEELDKLLLRLKKAEEKAWQYDELCK